MTTKFCNGCKTEKLLSEFWLKHGKPQYRCKDCQKAYHKKHYKDQIDRYKKRAATRNNQIKNEIRSFIRCKKDKPCQDCGVKYPYYVMDFDHRPDEIKVFNLAKSTSRFMDLQSIANEIEKCDLVCSNCHRIRTHNRSVSRDTQED